MSDDLRTCPDLNADAVEIKRRIAHWTKWNACPFCDTQDWFVLNRGADGESVVGAVVTTITDAGKVPAYTLFCGNCGFVRQHVASIVDGETRLKGPS